VLSRDIDVFEEAARRVEEHPEIYDAPLAQDYSPVHNPAAVPMPRSFIPVEAHSLSSDGEPLSEGFLDALRVRANQRDIAHEIRDRPFRFLVTLATAWIVVRFKAAARWVRSLFRTEPTDVNVTVTVRQVRGIRRFLSRKAKRLLKRDITSTVYQRSGVCVPCRYATIRVPVSADGKLPRGAKRRWAIFLNDLAARGIWQHGTLAGPSQMRLVRTQDRPFSNDALLFTFLFTDDPWETTAALNERVGFPIFTEEGQFSTADWAEFPWV
jgi:hypothetical protein